MVLPSLGHKIMQLVAKKRSSFEEHLGLRDGVKRSKLCSSPLW